MAVTNKMALGFIKDHTRAPDQKQPKAVVALRLALAVFGLFFLPSKLLLRFLNDERKRMEYNKELPESQRVPPLKSRIKLIWLSSLILAAQLGSIFGLLTGAWVSGLGPAYHLKRLLTKLKVPELSEVLNYYVLAIFLLSIVASGLIYFLNFKYSKSRYAKLFIELARKPEGRDDEKELLKPAWYYPGKMIFVDLLDRTGDEVIKDKPLWNRADFSPTDAKKIKHTNQYILTSAPEKPSSSTYLYDRYDEWTSLVQDKMKIYHWQLGEYVNKNEYLWKSAHDDFSIAFIGQSGSGKTEAMKSWLTNFLCKHTSTHFIICDLKRTADWDSFAPLTETGRIIKTPEETLLAIAYFEDLLNLRTKYMAEKGYKNIRTWSETEGIIVPPVLLIIDEFPQMNGPLKWDVYSRKDATPANVLFKLYTTGRSFGLWVVLGSQFSGSDAIPSEMNKNIKVHVVLKTGSEGESMQWINSGAAFWIGKNVFKEDGTEDRQVGYAYVDGEQAFVRFWYADDWLIVHEFLKYGVPTIEGAEHFRPRKMSIPMAIRDKLKLVDGNRKALSEPEQRELAANEAAQVKFEQSYAELAKTLHPGLTQKKTPMGILWEAEEPVDQYFLRLRRERGLKAPGNPQLATPGGFPGNMGGAGNMGGGGGSFFGQQKPTPPAAASTPHPPPPAGKAGIPGLPGDTPARTINTDKPGAPTAGDPAIAARVDELQRQEMEFEAMIERRRQERAAALAKFKKAADTDEASPKGDTAPVGGKPGRSRPRKKLEGGDGGEDGDGLIPKAGRKPPKKGPKPPP